MTAYHVIPAEETLTKIDRFHRFRVSRKGHELPCRRLKVLIILPPFLKVFGPERGVTGVKGGFKTFNTLQSLTIPLGPPLSKGEEKHGRHGSVTSISGLQHSLGG